jgi:Zn-dependent M28 family amino/carboxypeptidase
MKPVYFFLLLVIGIVSCKENTNLSGDVSEETIRKHVAALSSDDFQGRKPFTAGEEKTVAYLQEEIKKIGLQPGNGDKYTQDVPMIEITGHPSETMELTGPTNITLKLRDQYTAYTERPVNEINLAGSDLVFCGYGIVAPEYGWNDYEGLDMKGKTALVLVNDPGLGSEDSTFFKGSTMTYYGRWTYKYEEAARQGAAAIMIIHETTMAGYPWAVVQGMGSGAKLNLEAKSTTPCELQGWVSLDAAKDIFTSSGIDLRESMMAARKPGFKAIPLPYKVTASTKNEIRENVSRNVVGIIPGTDQKEEYIIFSAHWDHLGIGAVVEGDSIYNGARDNASGTATLMGIAEAMVKSGPYKRTVVFLWVTAEEQGLLGSAYYADHPIFSPAQTVANLNIDGMATYGEMNDLSVIGFGQSELEAYAARWAEAQGRYILPDQEPEKGYFFRSDHFNFAKIGIPALYAEGGFDHKTKGKEYAKEKSDEYRTTAYHQPSDEYNPETFELGGMLQDATLYCNLAKELANNQDWPKWKEGSEFKAIRDASKK